MRSNITRLAFVSCFILGCGGDGDELESVELEMCEHMREGPFETVTATTSSASAALSDAAFAHARVDIDLPPDAPGYVAFDVAEAGDVVIALDRAIGFQVFRLPGEPVEAESSTEGSELCSEIARQYVYELEVRSYILQFTETDPEISMIGLVAESLGAHEEEH